MSSDTYARVHLDEGKIRLALGDPDTPGLVLLMIVIYVFQDQVFGDPEQSIEQMDPAEMWADLHSHYGTWVSEEGENKLNAIITGLEGGRFWGDLDVFMAVSTALFDGDMGDIITVGFERLSATELMWSIIEMNLAWDSDDIPEFSLDIQEYIEETMAMEQEEQEQNAAEVAGAYHAMLDQMRGLGIPTGIIRSWDEEYAAIVDDLEDGKIG